MTHAEMDARIAAIRAWQAEHPVVVTDATLRELDRRIREGSRWEARCARQQRHIDGLVERRARILDEIAAVTAALRRTKGRRRGRGGVRR